MIERLAGRFVPIRVLGQGGMGQVVLVHDLATRSECALKRLRSDTVAHRGALAREFALLARVRHPAIVGVLDLGYTPEGSPWFTMQYVPGRASDQALGGGVDDAFAFVAAEIALGLEVLHAAGIVHGDLKPSNVLVVSGGDSKPASARILDFGLATLVAHPAMGHVGTAGYAAPEVVQGGRPTVASDLYGLGATLYHLIAGRAPFEGADASERLRQQAKGPPATWPLEAAGAPAGLVSLILRLMADAAEERPRDAREVRAELESLLPRARRPLGERIETAMLVGRERELSRIDRWMESGAARMLVVAGEPGMGRTSLIDAAVTRAALARRPVARANVTAGDGDLAFARGLRHQIASALGAEVKGADDAADVEVQAEAVLATCRRERAGKSLLVVVDGSEHLGAPMRALLRRLVLDPQVRARVVQTRPTAWRFDDEGPLDAAGAIEVIELGPLDREGTEQLVSARLGGRAPAPLLAHLLTAAGGHPGLTVELLQAAAVSHAIADGEDGLRVDAARLATVEAPHDFVVARLRRLASAAAEVRNAALALAVLGAPAGSRPGLERGIAGLVALGLASRDADGRVTLSPPAIGPPLIAAADGDRVRALHHEALARQDLGVGERMRHHAAIGDVDGALAAAESAWAREPRDVPAALAARLAEPHAPERAASWHDRAAEQAWGAGRYGEVAWHAERALTMACDAGSAARWERLAAARFRAGQIDAVVRAVHAGLAADPSAGVRGRLLVTDAARRHAIGDYAGAFATATQAMRLAQDAGDHESEGHAALTAGSVLLALDRPDDAAAMADRAASCYARIGQGLGESRAAQLRGLVLRRQGRPADARHLYDTAMERARASASRLGVEECLFKLGQLHGDLGHGADCRAAYLATPLWVRAVC